MKTGGMVQIMHLQIDEADLAVWTGSIGVLQPGLYRCSVWSAGKPLQQSSGDAWGFPRISCGHVAMHCALAINEAECKATRFTASKHES